MSVINNLEKMSEILNSDEMGKLDAAASLHQKQSNIEFNITGINDQIVSIETEQGKTSGNYANFKSLIRRTGEVFDKYLPSGYTIHVTPIEYMESPSSVVNVDWINKQMNEKGIRIKQIAFDTGLDRQDVSGWVKGERTMSQIVKAMFYFYFDRF